LSSSCDELKTTSTYKYVVMERTMSKASNYGSNGVLSESDRKKEWKTLSHMECMLEKGIAKGLKGPIDADDHRACSAQSELQTLDRKTRELSELSESHANEARPISFGGGESWEVAANGESTADYSKKVFKPTLNPAVLEQPFKMCPEQNLKSWKPVVADKLVADSKVPNMWSRLKSSWKP